MKLAKFPEGEIGRDARNLLLSLDEDFREVEALREVKPAYCPCCTRVVQAVFLSHQYSRGVRVFDLYTCTCGDTIALNPSEEWERRHR